MFLNRLAAAANVFSFLSLSLNLSSRNSFSVSRILLFISLFSVEFLLAELGIPSFVQCIFIVGLKEVGICGRMR